MKKKPTLGIIGRGGVVSHFLEYIQIPKNEYALNYIDKIVFYNHDYPNEDVFRNSGAQDNNKASRVEVSLNLILKNKNIGNDVTNNFEKFIKTSQIIIDASAGYKPESLLTYATHVFEYSVGIRKGSEVTRERKNVTKPQFNASLNEDFKIYQEQAETKGKNVLPKEKFSNQWNFSKNLIDIIHKVDLELPIGMRIYDEFPFSAEMMIKRGQKILEALQVGHPIPTYINLVNEPCFTSNLLSSQCPELTSYLIGCTGADLIRLNELLNNEFSEEKKKAGYEQCELRGSVAGLHDKFTMIPIIKPQYGEDKKMFDDIFRDITPKKMHRSMEKMVSEYWNDHHHKDGDRVQTSVSENLMNTLINTSKSRGKELSSFPFGEDFLSNGYFHEDLGLFLVGKHYFRNGRVIAHGS